MKFIEDLDITGKKVFLRVDFNVPMKNGEVADDTRIRAALESINYIVKKNGIVVVASHLGRPEYFGDKNFSMAPVGRRLSQLLGKDVIITDDCIGDKVTEIIEKASPGDAILLENLRFYPEEKKNDPEFAKKLANLCDIYINNAFAVSHRENASVSSIVKFSNEAAAGHLLKSELDTYNRAVNNNPERPLGAVIGGAKVSSKLDALKNILDKVDIVIIGGAMANTFFAAKGIDIQKSLFEKNMISSCLDIIKKAEKNNVDLYLPVDAVAADEIKEGSKSCSCKIDQIPSNYKILDIGNETCKIFAKAINTCKTIVWNGPMGVFELPDFSKGTKAVGESIASSSGFTIAGGGDTDSAVHKFGLEKKINYISTGGGAFLTLMEGKSLPAVEALKKK
ncbi:MAG: phosphoglycerate kinase [Deltaproteobacteria bacterium]|nr:MAG: phosphoglycerate kinase [Deltaproteobacteria bacterium]